MPGSWKALRGLLAGAAAGLVGAGLTVFPWPPGLPLGSVGSLSSLALVVVLAASASRSTWLGLAPILGWAVGAWVVFAGFDSGPSPRGWALTVAAIAAAALLLHEARAFSRQSLAPMPPM